jgi:hypothetical protein
LSWRHHISIATAKENGLARECGTSPFIAADWRPPQKNAITAA